MGLYLRHPLSLEHETGPQPENAARITAIEERLGREDWHGLELVEAPAAELDQVLRIHPIEHIEAIERLAGDGGGMVDLDTVVSPRSYDAALRAAGAAAHAAGRLLDGESFAFCGLRPPGHHAERATAMGFCLFNNVAVGAAEALAAGAERVAILDWDVHHGNGTEAIFAATDELLYASIHQWPLYPGTGAAEFEGEGAGEGFNVNLPVPPGTGSEEFVALVEHVVVPIARAYEPGLIAISAGYDAHRDDPLASCTVETEAYADMTAAIRAVAAELEVPVLVGLEGGYSPPALADSVVATAAALEDGRPPGSAPVAAAEPHISRLRERWNL